MSHAITSARAAAPGRAARSPPVQRFQRSWTVPAPRPSAAPAVPAAGATRSPCSCGGGCPRCQAKSGGAEALRLSQPADAHEREAEQAASRVLAGQKVSIGSGRPTRDLMRSPQPGAPSTHAPAALRAGLQGPARLLDAGTRRQLESGLQQDLSAVRLHTGPQAAASAAAVQARAYTVGRDIVFGAGQYAPSTHEGQHLLAHELVHVLQQRDGAAPPGTVQRAPTARVADAGAMGPLAADQRRAAVSCPIDCCLWPLGTLHAMPLFMHASRGAQVPAGDASGSGIGAALHFIASGITPPVGDRCRCNSYRMIQVLETNNPAPGRGANRYVDNGGTATPFYGDVFLSGTGEHEVPAGYPDAGGRVTSTESIYDRPFRDPATLGTTNLSWKAETCVSCIKAGAPDLILGCATYGFARNYNTTTRSFDPVVANSPGCRKRPSPDFINTLGSDPTTSSYSFEAAPTLGDCCPRGDFNAPTGDTRYA